MLSMNKSSLLKASSMLVLTGLLVLATLGTLRTSSQTRRPTAIAPQVWEATSHGAQVDVLLFLQEQVDLTAVEELPTLEERRQWVYETLRATALRSQAALRAELDGAGVAYRPFYVANMIALRGGRDLLTKLAARPEVARIVANPSVRQTLPEPGPDDVRSQAVGEVVWNVESINADDVWGQGYTGEGIVVAGQDTGYDWDHPALLGQYRGYNGVTVTHDYHWHDAIHSPGSSCGADSPFPCDDHGHGTHTMGTMIGDDGHGNQVGVAPGAQWIGCRNMDEGVGSPATYAECFEFFLAPYPVGGDPFTEGEPSLAPHVINNSWTCPPSEGCDPGTLQTVVENVRAAGIVVVASAGNSGSSCGSVQSPLAIYDAAFSVGATDRSGIIAGFSGRGPVTVDGSGRRKPDISAPGVRIYSSVPGTAYGPSSGTSMAGPHVAGTVALLWSAAPSLIGDVDATEDVIGRAARPRTTTQGCGGDGAEDVPNNVYGWGIVDALAAVEHVWVPISNQAIVHAGFPTRTVRYSLTVTNEAPFALTDVMIMDTMPLSTSLAWADEGYELVGRTVSWTVPLLSREAVLSRTLEVALEGVAPGSRIVNDQYGVMAAQLSGPVTGMPIDALIPWRVLLHPVFKDEG
jgi:subtilisin family serine protease